MGARHALIIGVEEADDIHYLRKFSFGGAQESAKFFEGHFLDVENFPKKNVKYFHTNSDENKPTYDNITNYFITLKKKFKKGDLLTIYFCGHSVSIKKEYADFKLINAKNEDEGWVLYDKLLFHFEIWELLKDFPAGSKIVVLADTCYSDATGLTSVGGEPDSVYKKEVAIMNVKEKTFLEEHLEDYNKVLRKSNTSRSYKVTPAVVIIGAGDETSIIPGADSRGRTNYSKAFERSIFDKKHDYRPKHLSELYDRMVAVTYRDLADRYLEDAYFFAEANRGKLPVPQWHYHVGKKHTKLRVKSPIFE